MKYDGGPAETARRLKLIVGGPTKNLIGQPIAFVPQNSSREVAGSTAVTRITWAEHGFGPSSTPPVGVVSRKR